MRLRNGVVVSALAVAFATALSALALDPLRAHLTTVFVAAGLTQPEARQWLATSDLFAVPGYLLAAGLGALVGARGTAMVALVLTAGFAASPLGGVPAPVASAAFGVLAGLVLAGVVATTAQLASRLTAVAAIVFAAYGLRNVGWILSSGLLPGLSLPPDDGSGLRSVGLLAAAALLVTLAGSRSRGEERRFSAPFLFVLPLLGAAAGAQAATVQTALRKVVQEGDPAAFQRIVGLNAPLVVAVCVAATIAFVIWTRRGVQVPIATIAASGLLLGVAAVVPLALFGKSALTVELFGWGFPLAEALSIPLLMTRAGALHHRRVATALIAGYLAVHRVVSLTLSSWRSLIGEDGTLYVASVIITACAVGLLAVDRLVAHRVWPATEATVTAAEEPAAAA